MALSHPLHLPQQSNSIKCSMSFSTYARKFCGLPDQSESWQKKIFSCLCLSCKGTEMQNSMQNNFGHRQKQQKNKGFVPLPGLGLIAAFPACHRAVSWGGLSRGEGDAGLRSLCAFEKLMFQFLKDAPECLFHVAFCTKGLFCLLLARCRLEFQG